MITNVTINEINEKLKISNNACVGAYSFESGELLLSTINEVIKIENNKQIFVII